MTDDEYIVWNQLQREGLTPTVVSITEEPLGNSEGSPLFVCTRMTVTTGERELSYRRAEKASMAIKRPIPTEEYLRHIAKRAAAEMQRQIRLMSPNDVGAVITDHVEIN